MHTSQKARKKNHYTVQSLVNTCHMYIKQKVILERDVQVTTRNKNRRGYIVVMIFRYFNISRSFSKLKSKYYHNDDYCVDSCCYLSIKFQNHQFFGINSETTCSCRETIQQLTKHSIPLSTLLHRQRQSQTLPLFRCLKANPRQNLMKMMTRNSKTFQDDYVCYV